MFLSTFIDIIKSLIQISLFFQQNLKFYRESNESVKFFKLSKLADNCILYILMNSPNDIHIE